MGKKIHPKPPKQQPKPKPRPQAPKPVAAVATPTVADLLPFALQQRILATFGGAFAPVLNSDSLPSLLQEVKAALYARDFDAAFARASPEALDAYAARWSPTRALAYAAVLAGVEEHLAEVLVDREVEAAGVVSGGDNAGASEEEKESAPTKSIKMISIGGGAAEIAALAAWLSTTEPAVSGSVTLLDSAPWSSVVTKLHDALTSPPPLSKYASAAARAANTPLLEPSRLASTFSQSDVLSLDRGKLSTILGKEPVLVTLLFTLNELYTSAGVGKTTAFLHDLSAVAPAGTLLLVVDSPGSYSEAAVGKESKKYPMQWLLDHTLTKDEKPVEGCLWEKVESHDSVWFRLAETLHYPIALENMRYQMHLYRASRP
ncbi:25S rRNA (uridine(2843)-N(3))-methyltransferase [Colletotrichum plurivorum]|uniref:25S rRNA (Uridine(2843)-N(3))-methyltransferase n=1 Tax=Colletotrichum plurivorum TaxID=2175906 RepID=A0A8H6KXA3_9PEZI|nr:25S rRNA (uridine(2843)-N(3))-methyltransferase [Colletotrichum plurivorum]